MLLLHTRQCPRCVLRFGSSSELDEHLRLDHRPAARRAQPQPSEPEPPAQTDEQPPTRSAVATQRFVVEAIVTAALIAFIAIASWHAAALFSVGLVAALAVRASLKARRQE